MWRVPAEPHPPDGCRGGIRTRSVRRMRPLPYRLATLQYGVRGWIRTSALRLIRAALFRLSFANMAPDGASDPPQLSACPAVGTGERGRGALSGRMVHEVRFELTGPTGHQVLSPARLPVPPFVRMVRLEGVEPTTCDLRDRCSAN